MKHAWIAVAALALAGACVSHAPPQKAAEGEKICKSETVLGRMIPEEVCKTSAEWAAEREKKAENVRDTARRIRSNSNTSAGVPKEMQ
jgi:hypothetical protein